MQSTKLCIVFIALFFLSSCAMVRKQPIVPTNLVYQSAIPNMPKVRVVLNPFDFKEISAFFTPTFQTIHNRLVAGQDTNTLVVSGGGANGAYGAGVLWGWSQVGTRPKFDMVTGVSTGSFIGMFAFLGTGYDEQLKNVYTTLTDKRIFIARKFLSLIFGRNDSLTSTEPFKKMLASYVTTDVLKTIAAEHRKGRYFYVATVQLDARRVVIWDMGKIAEVGTPQALDLFRNVLLASAAIPVVFSPVHFSVTAQGKTYDELHVDGGVGFQLFGGYYPKAALVNAKGQANLYIIRNGKLAGDNKKITPGIIEIANNSIDMIMTNQAIGDIIRCYAVSHELGVNFNLAFIPQDFNESKRGEFDPVYMQKLFALAYKQVENHSLWKDDPYIFQGLGW